MVNQWKPKKMCLCDKCGWRGLRAIAARKCPRCRHWHPRPVTPNKG